MELLLDQPEEPDVLREIEAGLSGLDEAAARRTLRAQITRLEDELAACFVTSFQQRMRDANDCPVTGAGQAPRLMSLGELEQLRDQLAARIREGRLRIGDHADQQERNRIKLEKMRVDPASYRGHTLRRIDVGEPGCGTYEVRPRLGLIGMLCGWWHVKVSSGCPLGQPGAFGLPAPPT